MTDLMIQFLKDINIGQLIAMGIMFWFFYTRLDRKINESRIESKQDKDELKDEIKSLADKVEDIDRRLCRIEGSLATQGHCLFSQSQTEKKVQ